MNWLLTSDDMHVYRPRKQLVMCIWPTEENKERLERSAQVHLKPGWNISGYVVVVVLFDVTVTVVLI